MGNPGQLVLKEPPALELPGHTAPTEEGFKHTKPLLFFPKYRSMDQLGSHDMNAEIKCRVIFLWGGFFSKSIVVLAPWPKSQNCSITSS